MMKIAVCGSMQFQEAMNALAENLRGRAFDVYLPEPEEQKIDDTSSSDQAISDAKNHFIRAHLEKIRRSDAILIANYSKKDIPGYIGANTLMEAAFAFALEKKIFILNDLGSQPCRPEVLGMKPTFLHGALEGLI